MTKLNEVLDQFLGAFGLALEIRVYGPGGFAIKIPDVFVEVTRSEGGFTFSEIIGDMSEVGFLLVKLAVVAAVGNLTFRRLLVACRELNAEIWISGVQVAGAEDSLSNDLAVGGKVDEVPVHDRNQPPVGEGFNWCEAIAQGLEGRVKSGRQETRLFFPGRFVLFAAG